MGEKRGRNDPCTCGSGKKYKECCLNRPQGFSNRVPVRWIANIYRFFLVSAEELVKRGNRNRRPGSYEGLFLGPYLEEWTAPFLAFMWTLGVLLIGLIAMLSVLYWLVYLIGIT